MRGKNIMYQKSASKYKPNLKSKADNEDDKILARFTKREHGKILKNKVRFLEKNFKEITSTKVTKDDLYQTFLNEGTIQTTENTLIVFAYYWYALNDNAALKYDEKFADLTLAKQRNVMRDTNLNIKVAKLN